MQRTRRPEWFGPWLEARRSEEARRRGLKTFSHESFGRWLEREHGIDISGGALSQFGRLDTRAKRTTIEVVAAVYEVDPDSFIDYRLARARQLFDEWSVGHGDAARHLRLLSPAGRRALIGGDGRDWEARDLEDAARAVEEALAEIDAERHASAGSRGARRRRRGDDQANGRGGR